MLRNAHAVASLAVSILMAFLIGLVSVIGTHWLGIARSNQINARIGVDLNSQCIARRVSGCISKPFLEEQVLLSSLSLDHHTHTQDPYSGATLCDEGSCYQGCHPSHSLATLLRQSKQLAGQTFTPSSLKASHLQGWGSRLKHRTGTTFAHRHTSERTCSTFTVGVLTLIQFVLPAAALSVP
jgi:hypothetical protein